MVIELMAPGPSPVSVRVLDIIDYAGDIMPPEGAVAAIVVCKDDEDLVPLFVRPGIAIEITELLMGRP